MSVINRSRFTLLGVAAAAAEDWNKRSLENLEARNVWLKGLLGDEFDVYTNSSGQIKAVASKTGKRKGPDGLRAKVLDVAGVNGRPIKRSVFVPDKRTKLGKEMASKFDSFHVEPPDQVVKAMGFTSRNWFVLGNDNRRYLVGLGLRKLGSFWYASVPTEVVAKEAPAPAVVAPLKEWEYLKLLEEHKEEDDE
jgi:hypothetical protein